MSRDLKVRHRRRLNVAFALADYNLFGGDHALAEAVRRERASWAADELAAYGAKPGTIDDRTALTTVFVTHDQDEAMELADRVAILIQGRLEQVGSPGEIARRPASRFGRKFVG